MNKHVSLAWEICYKSREEFCPPSAITQSSSNIIASHSRGGLILLNFRPPSLSDLCLPFGPVPSGVPTNFDLEVGMVMFQHPVVWNISMPTSRSKFVGTRASARGRVSGTPGGKGGEGRGTRSALEMEGGREGE